MTDAVVIYVLIGMAWLAIGLAGKRTKPVARDFEMLSHPKKLIVLGGGSILFVSLWLPILVWHLVKDAKA